MTRENLQPNCWIRGDMSPRDIEDDPVRQATQNCKYRVARPSRGIFGGKDHFCSAPGAISEHEPTQVKGRAVIAGGIDGYATFCEAVDMHLTSPGEKSRFIIEGQFTVKGQPQLPSGKK
jgi:hypothetical protein